MARKNGMAKIEPAMRTMTFELGATGSHNIVYIDLMQCASIVNRRAYRQGLNVAVGGFTLVRTPSTGSGDIQIQSLPNTWVLSNAWEKAFRMWKKQQDTVLEGQESVKARFNDFKVHFDQGHVTATTANNLLPVGYTGVPYLAGTWDMSQIVVPNAGAPGVVWEPYLNMLGGLTPAAGNPSIGLIQAYANSRSVPASPAPSVSADITFGDANIYRAMFDVGDNSDEVLDNVVGKNELLPYSKFIYPGESAFDDQTEFVASISLGNTQTQTQVAGANFPCGLIKIDQSGLTGSVKLVIHMVPGDHRGYLCESMVDM